ncbi:MAG: hypothetical protein GVY02_00975 [Bacteroidetes bacterium]|nr:hypothetical protein [Bacteroidota bacterium]
MTPSTRIFAAEDLPALLLDWIRSKPVFGPQERRDQPGFYYFDWIACRDVEIERLARLLITGYTTTTIPPKAAFFPTRELLFRFTRDKLDPPNQKKPPEEFLLVGVHPCDLAALGLLDSAYGQPPADGRWQQQRRLATVLGIDCLPDEYCFCTSMKTSASREGCDLFLIPLEHRLLAEVHSSNGERLLRSIHTRPAQPKDLSDRKAFLHMKEAAVHSRLQAEPEGFAEILENTDLEEIWKRTAERCYSCGSCNTTCPACFCFDMEDSLDPGLVSGERYRSWGSCQLLDFALIAGDTNTRAGRRQRVAHRWYRKFLYLHKQFGRSYCTGCGRCSRACTADINIVEVSNQVISKAEEEQ